MEETARLLMPAEGEDCLCRECLRKAATATTSRVDDRFKRL
jgi:hypothetical protein